MTSRPLSALTMLLSRHTKRREFIMLLGGATASPALWPFVARAQQAAKVYRIGFLWEGPTVFPDAIDAFRRGLRDLGYVEGRNIAVEPGGRRVRRI